MPLPIYQRTQYSVLRNTIYLVFMMGIISFLPTWAKAQCTASAQAIPDDGTLTINFSVTGLTDLDLASPTQGICGVQLDFMHEFLGDLVISLVSPSGTIVQLVGPAPAASSPTNLSRFNVQFVPCMTAPAPDPGFAGVWSNLQAWQVFTPYSGMYHPNSGCLEDFNIGPANGTWQLIIEDQDPLQTGLISSAMIIFCNPTGLNCVECNPVAGTLAPDALAICEGESVSTSIITVNQSPVPPDPSLYSYTYLLTNANTIVSSGSTFTISPPPGIYTLCGLSYLTSDAAALNTLISSNDYSQVTTAVSNGTICGDLTAACIVVNVQAQPDTVVNNVLLCKNETYIFRGQVYSLPGTYYVVEQTGICDSVFRLNITANNLLAVIATPDTMSCGGGGSILNGTLSQGTGIMYEWTTDSGVLSGNLTSSQVTALVPGTYMLAVRDGSCTSMAEVTVYGDNTYPQIYLDDKVLTCTNPTVTLHPVVFPSNVVYSWTGPGGFTSSTQIITVATPGRYYLRVISTNGCEAFDFVDITENKIAPVVNIQLLANICQNNFAVLGVNLFDYNYAWTGPMGPLAIDRFISVVDPGIYSVTVTDRINGCTGSDTYNYIPDYDIPEINISGLDSLRCNSSVVITIADDNFGPPPHWTGPNGFVMDGSPMSLTQPGVYTVQVTGQNFCMNSTTVEVAAAVGYPAYEIVNDTITCNANVATIGINAPQADIFSWTGIPLPQGGNAFLQVMFPGVYFVTALDTNSGCMIEASAFVYPDLSPPFFSVLPDTITCQEPAVSLDLIPIPGQNYATIYWQLPDMTIINNPSITVNEPGLFLLTVIGQNGCINSSLVPVGVDTIKPVFFLEPDTLGCNLEGFINTVLIDSLSGINWIGPGGFTSSDLVPMIFDTGNYVAIGIGLNGCSTTANTHVAGDFIQPAINVTTEEITCIVPNPVQMVSSTDSVIAYTWTDASGNIVSTDSTAIISTPGVYYVTIEGDNHCFSRDTINLVSPDFPEVNVISDTLTCLDALALVVASTNVIDPMYAWIDINGDTIIHDSFHQVSTLGPFIISVTGPNGCTTVDTILVPSDSILPQVVIDIIGEVRCQNRDFMLDASSSSPSSINFDWQTIGGEILSLNDFPLIDARDTGLYVVTVYDTLNGCAATDSIFVSEHPDAIKLAYINVKKPECAGDANAEILVFALDGGVEPFTYRLNGLVAQTDKHFKGLLGGDHLIEISDSEGCIYDTIVFVKPSSPYTVDAGPDQEIFIGDEAILSGATDILPEDLLTQDWDSSGLVFCMDCPQSFVSPHATSTYRFIVTSNTGCVVEDFVTVYVIEEGQFFIANIFSPNGDGVNDEVHFNATAGTKMVLQWIIFDRWGNAVFGKNGFLPNDPSIYWDGRAQGSETLNPGVFAYVAEIELVNGSKRVHHGTITLIR